MPKPMPSKLTAPAQALSEPILWKQDNRLSVMQGDMSYQYVEIPGQLPPVDVIALHGWLDNSASFVPLIYELLGYTTNHPVPALRIYMLDFTGHGLSFHRPAGCSYAIWDYGFDVAQFITALALPKVTLVGHSMGACVAPIITHILPDKVASIFAIEALGPIVNEASQTAQQLQGILEKQLQQHLRPIKTIESFAQAVQMRMQGMFKLSEASATLLVERNLKQTEGGYQWRSDRRLTLPSPVRMCTQQLHNLLSELKVPVTLIAGDRLQQQSDIEQRVACVPNIVWCPLAGGHHLHMEEQVTAIVQTLYTHMQYSS